MKDIPTNYKNYLDNFVSDLYKKIDEEEEKRKALKIADDNYLKLQKQLEELIEKLNQPVLEKPIQFIGNAQFLKLMDISQKTAQNWRDSGVVKFSQVGSKIYYRISDIQELLDCNYKKSKNK